MGTATAKPRDGKSSRARSKGLMATKLHPSFLARSTGLMATKLHPSLPAHIEVGTPWVWAHQASICLLSYFMQSKIIFHEEPPICQRHHYLESSTSTPSKPRSALPTTNTPRRDQAPSLRQARHRPARQVLKAQEASSPKTKPSPPPKESQLFEWIKGRSTARLEEIGVFLDKLLQHRAPHVTARAAEVPAKPRFSSLANFFERCPVERELPTVGKTRFPDAFLQTIRLFW